MSEMSDASRAWADEEWAGLTDVQRIAATAFILRHISESVSHPGSFCQLIYDRIGLGYDAYGDVLLNGGMDVTNFIFGHGGKNAWLEHSDKQIEVDW